MHFLDYSTYSYTMTTHPNSSPLVLTTYPPYLGLSNCLLLNLLDMPLLLNLLFK